MEQSLEQKTLRYWVVSRTFYTGVGPNLNSSQAMKMCNDTADTLGPQRRLRYKLWELNDRIIQGRGRRRKTPKHPDNVIAFAQQG